ncbi:MAG: hypothetical protein IKU25_05830, partial [Clostridia bacterium]|nr:hypothetical protein [Clostridia bacterium]
MAKKEEYNPIIFDDFNGRIKADQSCIGTLTTNCGNDAERNGVKITEMEAPITTRGNDIAGAIRASLYRQGERNIRRNIEDGKGYEGVIEPCICAARGRQSETDGWQQKLEVGDSQTSNALTTVQKDNLVLEQNELARCKEIGEMRGGKWENTMEKSRRVYGVDGLSTTCTTCGGGNQEIKVMVKNATKQGYLEATVGDGI